VKKLVLLAVGAILLLGVVAVVAVLIASGGDGAPASPAPIQPSGAAAPAPAAAPPSPPAAAGYPPGPRRVELPAGRVKAVLSEPLVPCFKRFPPHSSLPAVLTLELEAQSSGGFAVLGSSVKSWGGATAALVECVRQILPGQVVPGGSFTMGERALYDFELSMPPSIAPPPPPEPPPSSLPANRAQQPSRRGASR
jgi:hypothetical protein